MIERLAAALEMAGHEVIKAKNAIYVRSKDKSQAVALARYNSEKQIQEAACCFGVEY